MGSSGGGGEISVDPTAAAAAATQTERILLIEASRKQVQSRIRQIIENANLYTGMVLGYYVHMNMSSKLPCERLHFF